MKEPGRQLRWNIIRDGPPEGHEHYVVLAIIDDSRGINRIKQALIPRIQPVVEQSTLTSGDTSDGLAYELFMMTSAASGPDPFPWSQVYKGRVVKDTNLHLLRPEANGLAIYVDEAIQRGSLS